MHACCMYVLYVCTLCAHVCMYVCMYVCIYVCIYISTYQIEKEVREVTLRDVRRGVLLRVKQYTGKADTHTYIHIFTSNVHYLLLCVTIINHRSK